MTKVLRSLAAITFFNLDAVGREEQEKEDQSGVGHAVFAIPGYGRVVI